MFDPKITPGPWDKEYIEQMMRHIDKNVDIESFHDFEKEEGSLPGYYGTDDHKSISAVPELLGVYKEAKKCLDDLKQILEEHEDDLNEYNGLVKALKNLEDRHCLYVNQIYKRLRVVYQNYLTKNDCRPSEARIKIIDELNQKLFDPHVILKIYRNYNFNNLESDILFEKPVFKEDSHISARNIKSDPNGRYFIIEFNFLSSEEKEIVKEAIKKLEEVHGE